MTDRYAVMGNPIEHSLSPQIHQLFAAQTGQDIEYRKILVELDAFEDELRNFQLQGGKGLNITVPFKQRAYAYVDIRTARAQQAGAVNSIIFKSDASCIGDNTDGIGLLRDLTQNLHWVLSKKRILLLGAGGAASGVIGPLLEHSPANLHIANRTVAKAVALATAFSENKALTYSGYAEIPDKFDIVINATSSSLHNEVPKISADVLADNTGCYDMMYGKEPTLFLRWAQRHGVQRLADGLGMLVEQAAEAFYIWRDVMPATAEVIATIRDDLSKK